MKAILEFNLPEDNDDFDMAVKGVKYFIALDEIRNRLRNILKYNSDHFNEQELELIEKAQKEFFEILEEVGIEI